MKLVHWRKGPVLTGWKKAYRHLSDTGTKRVVQLDGLVRWLEGFQFLRTHLELATDFNTHYLQSDIIRPNLIIFSWPNCVDLVVMSVFPDWQLAAPSLTVTGPLSRRAAAGVVMWYLHVFPGFKLRKKKKKNLSVKLLSQYRRAVSHGLRSDQRLPYWAQHCLGFGSNPLCWLLTLQTPVLLSDRSCVTRDMEPCNRLWKRHRVCAHVLRLVSSSKTQQLQKAADSNFICWLNQTEPPHGFELAEKYVSSLNCCILVFHIQTFGKNIWTSSFWT